MARTEVTGKQIRDSSVDLAVDVTGVLPVGKGGSGSDTLPLNNVLLGNGSGALQAVAPGAAGYVLTSDGTTWVSAAPTGATGAPAQGASGQRGSVWYQGAAAPGSIEGQLDGDYFLNTTNGDVYQRQSGSWVLVANLTGPAGASGSPGASGADGASGAPGATGASGAKGDPGDPGPVGATGPAGADGASGAPGTDGSVLASWQGEWDNYAEYGPGDIVSLGGSTWILDNHAGWTVGGAPPAYGWALFTAVGATGASGAPGADGATGASGAKGDQGDPGPSGSPGQDGASGSPGATGPTGASGAQGEPGPSGAPGADGASGQRGSLWYQGSAIPGSSGASGITGEYDGDFYLHISTGDVYELVGLSWQLIGSIKGIPGNDGASGPPGADGAVGATGPTGATGATGGTGAPGASGAPGPSTVADDVLTVQNAADATKQLRFSVAGVTTGTTRTLTVPDVSSTIEVTSRRGAANGYASLDENTKVPVAQLPDGVAVDDVVLTGTSFQFYSGATAIGDPISLLIANLDGGTPSSTSTGYVDGGTL